ncbi:hypothetical protein [Streptomyces sp. ZSW22]|uniref:hypothetical protein n=1 Tax=Streptomyces sp. ZSW22 TaxID=3055050 RepID=UPI0025B0EDA0|nr:hypothetical protein [Streptomyces sp. ZSW22]MDN3244160.1 hypothetical protein [Streptomyces sp. ZSW22]
MALNINGLLNAVVSHAMASGHFARVNQHEPENAPGQGLTCAVWADRITAIRSSGLNSVSTLVSFNVRIFTLMFDPPDAIDPTMIEAVDALCAAYTGDFTLGGLVRQIDVLGAYGQPLDVRAGYLQQDGTRYRVMDIVLPCIVNDLWEETP